MLKQQVETLLQENANLKRAFATQHERLKEFEDRGNEVNQLKQMVAQYQEQLRTLEVRLPSSNLLHSLYYLGTKIKIRGDMRTKIWLSSMLLSIERGRMNIPLSIFH